MNDAFLKNITYGDAEVDRMAQPMTFDTCQQMWDILERVYVCCCDDKLLLLTDVELESFLI